MKISGGKYEIRDNRIVNVKTGEVIPEDEPTFLLRGRDENTPLAIIGYKFLLASRKPFAKSLAGLDRVTKAVIAYQHKNPDLKKLPD